MWLWILIIVVVFVLLFVVVDREIYFYEGTHLTPRIQAWLYDRWAEKYDTGKRESQLQDAQFLAKPLTDALADNPAPFILDIATGTGRLPFALTNEADFNGHIIAVDISQGMLVKAAKKLADKREFVHLMQYEQFPLPFPDESFDVIACLEALEVMPEMHTPLAELMRLLRPGGILLTSRGTEASGRKAKVVAADDFKMLLQSVGFINVEITTWWRIFDRVFACKPGKSNPIGHKSISDVLTCSNCQQIKIEYQPSGNLTCTNCGKVFEVDGLGIIEYK